MSRVERVTERVRRIVSTIVHEEIKDPRLGFVTITKVDMSPDLRNATIYFSVLGKEADYRNSKAALDSALGYIRKLVAEEVDLRFAPEIVFRDDRSSEYSVRIQELLDEVSRKKEEELQRLESEHKKARKKTKKKAGKKIGTRKSSRVRKKA